MAERQFARPAAFSRMSGGFVSSFRTSRQYSSGVYLLTVASIRASASCCACSIRALKSGGLILLGVPFLRPLPGGFGEPFGGPFHPLH
jgi:hypothetical protein